MISIRPAAPGDAGGIARVHVESWRSAYQGLVPQDFLDDLQPSDRERAWKHWLSSSTNGTYVYVATNLAGEVQGFATGGAERDQDPDFKGELYALYLLPEIQRQGVGTRLVQAVVHQLRLLGLDSMLIWVLEENPARKFYAALGGRHLPDHRRTITISGKTLYETAYGWNDLTHFQE